MQKSPILRESKCLWIHPESRELDSGCGGLCWFAKKCCIIKLNIPPPHATPIVWEMKKTHQDWKSKSFTDWNHNHWFTGPSSSEVTRLTGMTKIIRFTRLIRLTGSPNWPGRPVWPNWPAVTRLLGLLSLSLCKLTIVLREWGGDGWVGGLGVFPSPIFF